MNRIDTAARATVLTYVDPFPGRDGNDLEWDPCTRCGGDGYVASNVDGGICYGCNASKGQMVPVRTLRSRESGRISRLNKSEREWVAKAERHNENAAKAEAAYPILAGWHEAMDTNEFARDLWSKSFDYELSEKQIAALAAGMQRTADREAGRKAEADDAADVTEGRYALTGEVVMIKYYENSFSYSGSGQWKMIVKAADGSKVFVSTPAALLELLARDLGEYGPVEDLKGRTVTLTVTVEASADDRSFGFGKRPTKPLLAPAE